MPVKLKKSLSVRKVRVYDWSIIILSITVWLYAYWRKLVFDNQLGSIKFLGHISWPKSYYYMWNIFIDSNRFKMRSWSYLAKNVLSLTRDAYKLCIYWFWKRFSTFIRSPLDFLVFCSVITFYHSCFKFCFERTWKENTHM